MSTILANIFATVWVNVFGGILDEGRQSEMKLWFNEKEEQCAVK
jgi:hypothetical protein